MSIRSMTGFARVRQQSPDGEAVVTVKSVNHRGLDLHFQMPGVLDPYETAMRGLIRKRMSRGHIEIRVQYHRNRSQAGSSLNVELLDSYLEAFRQAGHRHSITAEPDLNMALRLPGMFEPAVDQEPEAELEAFLVGLLDEALTELNRVREREGAETAAVLAERTKAIREATAVVREIRSRALPAFQQRLKDRLAELLGGVTIDPQRLIQEAAILADRSDIGEEMARLDIHSEQLDQMLAKGGEVGKKMDFLLQEMNRETNTMLSKTNGVGEQGLQLTEVALGIKADIEKIREQSLNLE